MEKNKQQTMKEKDLKAFLVTYIIDAKENDIKSIIIVAFTKKEAGDIFIRWTKAKDIEQRITAVVVQNVKKTKNNKHLITLAFYSRQLHAIDLLERTINI